MSTANVQNLLSNVFHPTFFYDTTNKVYQSKLELTNIDTVSANTVSTYAVSVGDAACNVYVGLNAGNAHSNMTVSSNSNNTFVGPGAGGSTSNVRNSVFVGYRAGFGAVNGLNTISIGTSANGNGSNNICIGNSAGVSNAGNSNIFIGTGALPASSSFSNTMIVGPLTASTYPIALPSNYLIGADLSNNYFGLNLSNPSYTLDVNGYARIGTNSIGGLGINTNPLDYTLNVNGDMQVSDGYGVLRFTNSNGNSTTVISNTASYPTSNATLQVTGGMFSVRGVTAAVPQGVNPVNIGVWKKGVTMVCVNDSVTNISYCAGTFAVLISNSSYNVYVIASNSGGGLGFGTPPFTTSNIQFFNSGGTNNALFNYVITYFPTP